MNYSRSYWFNFLPSYHTGARLNYKFSDTVAVNYWATNGTQQTLARSRRPLHGRHSVDRGYDADL